MRTAHYQGLHPVLDVWSRKTRKRERVRARETRKGCLACLLLARPFFLVPATSKRMPRRLLKSSH